jgi:hypothetical protein
MGRLTGLLPKQCQPNLAAARNGGVVVSRVKIFGVTVVSSSVYQLWLLHFCESRDVAFRHRI